MKKLSSVVLTFLFTGIALLGQGDETLFGKNGLRLTGVWGSTETGFGFFDEETALTRSGYVLFEFNKMLFVGFGDSRTAESVNFDNAGAGSFKLKYGGLIAGFTPQAHRVIHPKFIFLMGNGRAKLNSEEEDKVFVVQPGAGAEINVFRWFRFGIEGGYRFVSGSDFQTLKNEDLSSPFVEMKFRFGWSWGSSRE